MGVTEQLPVVRMKLERVEMYQKRAQDPAQGPVKLQTSGERRSSSNLQDHIASHLVDSDMIKNALCAKELMPDSFESGKQNLMIRSSIMYCDHKHSPKEIRVKPIVPQLV